MHASSSNLAIRWTIGNVSPYGFEALRLSLWAAWHVFGTAARYVVCVNSLPLDQAREWTGDVPGSVQWRAVNADLLPDFLRPHLDAGTSPSVLRSPRTCPTSAAAAPISSA